MIGADDTKDAITSVFLCTKSAEKQLTGESFKIFSFLSAIRRLSVCNRTDKPFSSKEAYCSWFVFGDTANETLYRVNRPDAEFILISGIALSIKPSEGLIDR